MTEISLSAKDAVLPTAESNLVKSEEKAFIERMTRRQLDRLVLTARDRQAR